MAGKHEFHFDSRLLEHIEFGRVNEAKSMLNVDLIRSSDESMNTLLHYAVLGNSDEIVRHLIELGAVVDSPGKDGNSPITLSVQRADKSIDDFIDATTNVANVNIGDLTVLRMAYVLGVKIVGLVLKSLQIQAVDIEALADKLIAAGCNLWHCSMYLRNDQVVLCMLKRGLDVNTTNRRGMTALHIACTRRDGLTLAKLLLNHGADVNALNETRMSSLLVAACSANMQMMKLLLEAGADPNIADTPLENTAILMIFRNPTNVATEVTDECLDLLFQHGVIPKNPRQLLDIASRRNDSKKIDVLINYLTMLKELGRPIADSDFHCKQEQLHSTIPASIDSCRKFLSKQVYGNLTMLKLLTDCGNRMRIHVRNENVVSKLQQLLSDDENSKVYPYYCSTLTKRISKAVAIAKLEDTAIPILCKLLHRSYHQCYNFASEIVSYLDEQDLEQLCRAQ